MNEITITPLAEQPHLVDAEGFKSMHDAIRHAQRHGKINPYSNLHHLDTYPIRHADKRPTWGVTYEPAPVTPSRY